MAHQIEGPPRNKFQHHDERFMHVAADQANVPGQTEAGARGAGGEAVIGQFVDDHPEVIYDPPESTDTEDDHPKVPSHQGANGFVDETIDVRSHGRLRLGSQSPGQDPGERVRANGDWDKTSRRTRTVVADPEANEGASTGPDMLAPGTTIEPTTNTATEEQETGVMRGEFVDANDESDTDQNRPKFPNKRRIPGSQDQIVYSNVPPLSGGERGNLRRHLLPASLAGLVMAGAMLLPNDRPVAPNAKAGAVPVPKAGEPTPAPEPGPLDGLTPEQLRQFETMVEGGAQHQADVKREHPDWSPRRQRIEAFERLHRDMDRATPDVRPPVVPGPDGINPPDSGNGPGSGGSVGPEEATPSLPDPNPAEPEVPPPSPRPDDPTDPLYSDLVYHPIDTKQPLQSA